MKLLLKILRIIKYRVSFKVRLMYYDTNKETLLTYSGKRSYIFSSVLIIKILSLFTFIDNYNFRLIIFQLNSIVQIKAKISIKLKQLELCQ